jgi:hypothetical protein
VKFSEVLEQSPMPRRVGDVRLRYEPSLLIGEARRRPGLLPTLALAVGAACGLGAVVALLLPASAGPTEALALTLGVGCVLMLGMGVALEARARAVRRFVLNFATESLRLERPSRARGRPQTWVVHFDCVREVEVVSRPDGSYALRVEYAPEPGSPETRVEVLVNGARPEEIDTLRRVWRLLRNSFGLRAPQAPA